MAALKQGDTSDSVRKLQEALVRKGYKLVADGQFGPATYNAVVAFQKATNLVADGIAGNATLTALGLVQSSVLDPIPMPKANRSRSAAMPTLEAIGKITGVSPTLLATFASIESNFDYTVKASTSSATGWFQFLDKTWDDILTQTFGKYALKDNARRSLRTDPRANGLMGAEFLKDNARILRQGLGREPTDTELYAAHFFGAGTAKKFLLADQSALGAELFPRQAAANVGIFYARDKKTPLTIGAIIKLFESKVAAHRG
ncbi:tail fiber protein [Pseudomonas phage D6]|nr:tail fiber protein [Pseudomonas phage D6]